MTSERLGEMFEEDSAHTGAGKFPLVSIGGRGHAQTNKQLQQDFKSKQEKLFQTKMSDLQIENRCHEILQSLQSSSLNYSAKITPFSIYVTIRKSLVKQVINHPCEEDQTMVAEKPDTSSELEIMKSRCTFLETSNENLKVSLEQEVIENEGKSEVIKEA
jgi:hypothetical protein